MKLYVLLETHRRRKNKKINDDGNHHQHRAQARDANHVYFGGSDANSLLDESLHGLEGGFAKGTTRTWGSSKFNGA